MFALLLLVAVHNDVDDLVAKVMTAYGGTAAWSKVTAFRETGTVTPATRPGEGKLTREWQRPDRLRVEIVYPASTEVRIVDGDHGTQNGKEAVGMGLEAMRLQAARLSLPALLIEKRQALRDLGNHKIEIPMSTTISMVVEIDPTSGHIIKSTGKGAGIEFSTDYSDFRTVDGLLFAFREENSAQGTRTGTNAISTIEVTRSK
jgi:hypothetical protein